MKVGQQRNPAVEILDQRRAALDPVAGIVIIHTVNGPDHRRMNVAADDAVHRVILRVTHNRLLEFADERDGVLDALFRVSAQGPVAEPEQPPELVERSVQAEQKLVAGVADEGEPLDVLHDGIEFVPVNDQQAASVRGGVDGARLDGDGAV